MQSQASLLNDLKPYVEAVGALTLVATPSSVSVARLASKDHNSRMIGLWANSCSLAVTELILVSFFSSSYLYA